jgi:dipeptidyl aminopeptidase/acylaminoacyl peptidase
LEVPVRCRFILLVLAGRVQGPTHAQARQLEAFMTRARGCAVLIVLAIVQMSGGAQQAPRGRPLAIEDYYRVQTVASPAISPDGRWVVFTASTRVEEDNSTRTETFVVAADGSSRPARIVHYGKDVTSPSWTADGRLDYAAERQHWTIDPADLAAAPVKATAMPAGAVLSADGKWIAFAREKPQTKKERVYASDFERRHEERFKGVSFDWKDFQRDGVPFPAPDVHARPAAQLVIQTAGGAADELKVLVDQDVRPSDIAWRPDGRLLAFTADPDWRDELKYGNAQVFTVTLEGKVTRLTTDGYVYADTGFSPDGRYLSYVRSFGTGMIIEQKLNHGGSRDLFIRPLDGGNPVNLTANWELEPGETRWSPDGRYIYFTAETGGEAHLFRAAVPGGGVEQVTRGPRRLGSLTIDKAFRTIAYTVGEHHAPSEVYVAAIDGANERRLTDVHGRITAQVAFSKVDRLRWPSRDGTEIEGWLMLPYGYDASKGPYPLIVTSHGGPHSATGYTFDFKKQFFAANGYFVFDTNFRSSTGYGDAFKWATWGEWGKRDGEDVVSGIDYVLKRYPVDPKRVGHTGHSYGGFMTNWLITQYPDRFAAAITGAGITNWTSDYGTADIYRTKETEFFGTPWDAAARDRMIRQSPLSYAGNVKTPTLFVHGEVDQRVPYEEGEQMYFALKRRGIPAKMIQYAGQPHGIAGHWNNVHRMLNELAWWNQYLKGGPAPRSTSSPN